MTTQTPEAAASSVPQDAAASGLAHLVDPEWVAVARVNRDRLDAACARVGCERNVLRQLVLAMLAGDASPDAWSRVVATAEGQVVEWADPLVEDGSL